MSRLETPPLDALVRQAQQGDVRAYGQLVEATRQMVLGVTSSVLRDEALAQDAAQETYLRAFRRVHDLHNPAAFRTWLRRVAITVAMNVRRSSRGTFLRLDDVPEVPVLDEEESAWSELQRQRLAAALLTLTPVERQLCDRRYHGGWSIARLADAAQVDEGAIRKRLQRIRDKLRREIEMTEQEQIRQSRLGPDLPAKVVELLARPQLTSLPENPVGRTIELIRSCFSDLRALELPELVDIIEARHTMAGDAVYVDADEFHRVDERRILRYDLTLPLLLNVRYEGDPLRVWSEGKVYRRCSADATHLEAFHQAEVFLLDDRDKLDKWRVTGLVLQSVDRVLPDSPMRLIPTRFPMCSQAWELEIEREGRKLEVLAWGVFTDRIIRHVGGDPTRHIAIGIGYGLERLASLRYGIDDVRKVDAITVSH